MIFKTRVLSGEYDLINKYLINALKERGLWNKNIMHQIIDQRGSVQNIENFPNDLKPIFKTIWEIKMKTILNMAIDRNSFIDQSQSMNLWLNVPNNDIIASMIFYGWKNGLKTLCYYLHIKTASETLSYSSSNNLIEKIKSNDSCDKKNSCTSCSS